jgi:anti-sigma B factor antagonist
MAIAVEERELQSTAVLVVTGRITTGESHGVLQAAVRSLVERGRKRIVLDLEAVPFVDSGGLGELVSSYATVKQLGGSLKLANANRRIASALEVVKLTNVLQTTDLPYEPRHR